MAPYFRFPESEAMSQRFWGFRPRNPTCGLIGLQTGAKIFVWGNISYGAVLASICALVTVLPFFMSENNHTEEGHGPLVEHLYGLMQALAFANFVLFCWLWYVSWKLKKAVVEKDLTQLKAYYFRIILVLAIVLIPSLFEFEKIWLKAFLLDIPWYVFEIIGLIFTHGFIGSLMTPDNDQQDDLNRIQFSV